MHGVKGQKNINIKVTMLSGGKRSILRGGHRVPFL